MSLERLARELEETARQTAVMAEGVAEALEILSDRALSPDGARQRAAAMIVSALQGQDRVAQRCQNMAYAVRQFEQLPPGTPAEVFDEIWATLVLDELRIPTLSGSALKGVHGEVELF